MKTMTANGNSRLDGEAGKDLHDGLGVARQAGSIPILTPIGTQITVETATTTATRAKVIAPRPPA